MIFQILSNALLPGTKTNGQILLKISLRFCTSSCEGVPSIYTNPSFNPPRFTPFLL